MDARTDAPPATLLTHRELRLIVLGVLLPVFMGSLDNTILASALPTIGRDLGDVHGLPWLITIYLLAATAMMPLYGKIADIHGRRFTLRIAIALHIAGSIVCALAPSMLVLILGRALQGIGGAGLSTMGMVVLGDVAAPKERGKYYTYFSITYTSAGACGPALGGFLADHVHWSAIFWLNVPLGLLALLVTSTLLKKLPRYDRAHRLDVIGAVLIVLASVSFMLALNVAGVRYPWLSLPVLALFTCALVIGYCFVMRLMRAPEPLIPIAILKDPIVRWATIANGFGWGSIVGLNIFLPMYLQSVIGLSPTELRLGADGPDGIAQFKRRRCRSGARPRDALQGPADGRAGGGDRVDTPPGMVGRQPDASVVRGVIVPDWCRLRADALVGGGLGAERD